MLNSRYSIPKKIQVFLHNGLSYDFNFPNKDFADELDDNDFKSFGKYTEKYIRFSVMVNKNKITRAKEKNLK